MKASLVHLLLSKRIVKCDAPRPKKFRGLSVCRDAVEFPLPKNLYHAVSAFEAARAIISNRFRLAQAIHEDQHGPTDVVFWERRLDRAQDGSSNTFKKPYTVVLLGQVIIRPFK